MIPFQFHENLKKDVFVWFYVLVFFDFIGFNAGKNLPIIRKYECGFKVHSTTFSFKSNSGLIYSFLFFRGGETLKIFLYHDLLSIKNALLITIRLDINMERDPASNCVS